MGRRQPAVGLLGEDQRMTAGRRTTTALALVIAATVVASAVYKTSADDTTAPSATPSSTPTATAAPPPAPEVGSCHNLAFTSAAQPTDDSTPVPCNGKHTSVTIHVGELDPIVDGHLLTVDSRKVQDEIAADCPRQLGAYVGGDQNTQRLSRFEIVWFSPTVAQSDLGANWYRCDLVALRGKEELATLPRDVKGALSRPDGLARFGTCGNTSPDKPDFVRAICSERHSWKAIDTVDLPAKGKYLATSVTSDANAHCKDDASNASGGSLKITWSFEWPTRQQWTDGQRYGYCWVPS